MELRFLDKGTQLTIEVLNDDYSPLPEEPYIGQFYDMEGYFALSITSPELFNRYLEQKNFSNVKITFSRGITAYTFRGRINSAVTNRFGDDVVLVNVISPLEESQLRLTQRMVITLSANIYTIQPSVKRIDKLLFSGTTLDISGGGAGILTDFDITPEHGNDFIIEFPTLSKMLLCALKFSKKGGTSNTYKFTYGFMFDFDESSESKNDFMLSVLKHRLG